MPIGALLQKRRRVRHGESVLWPLQIGTLQSALRALKWDRGCLLFLPSRPRRVIMLASAILLPVLFLTACSKKGQDGEKKTVQKSEDDF
jgi:hypothetical protein